MKKTTPLTFAILTACAVLPAAGLLAQSPSPAPATTPSVSEPAAATTNTAKADAEKGHGMKAFAKLTPEEQEKVKAAHKKAMEDPAVKAAEANKGDDKAGKKAYRAAMHDAMVKADPSVAPILEKMKEERKEDHPTKKDLK